MGRRARGDPGFKIPQVRYHEEENLIDKAKREYKEYRQEVRSKSLKERSEMFGFFSMFWYGMTFNSMRHEIRNNAPTEVLEEVKKIQYDFFKENPQRIVCDPRLFKPLFSITVKRLGKSPDLVHEYHQPQCARDRRTSILGRRARDGVGSQRILTYADQ